MKTETKLVQVRLSSGDVQLVTWVEKRPNIKVGARLTLKDHAQPRRWWRVESVSTGECNAHDLAVHRGWDNNI